ncbi:MAG: DUF5686 family protein [Bacteroidota bacterium]
MFFKYLPFLLFSLPVFAFAQQTVIKGKITDAGSNDAIPFVNVYFLGTTIGTTTNFEGYYEIKTTQRVDSISASNIGYHTKTKSLKKGILQTINFQLTASTTQLQEVVILPTENPAFAIMRKVIKNKVKNDKRSLSAYEFESYNKVEIGVNNISEKFRKRKIIKKLTAIMDSLQIIAGEDGKPVLPVFISESISKFYYRDNPSKFREDIINSKITGVGMDDGTLLTQLIGTTFQQYNFYQNWLNILSKDFVSPIADGWRVYYKYYLTDSMYIGKHWCYKMEVKPKHPQDLAFQGTIWITDSSFALKQIDVTIGKSANLNYIEKLKIQQELTQIQTGAWLPVKTRVLVDVAEVMKGWTGMLAKFYTSNKDFKVNDPKDLKFYEEPIVVTEGALDHVDDEEFWKHQRYDSLSKTELHVYDVIDTLRNMPLIKTYIDIVNIFVNGYYTLGKIDLGPYLFTYAYNDIESHRFQLGFRTNYDFSKKLILKGYLAYGTLDQIFKYSASIRYIPSLKPRTEMGIGRRFDLRQVGLNDDIESNLFLSFSAFGILNQPYYGYENNIWFKREIIKGITQKIAFNNYSFDPKFDFCYLTDEDIIESFTTSELIFETRFAKGERFLQNDNERISLGTKKWPVFTIKYTLGINDVLNSDFDYHKLTLSVSDQIKMGVFGKSYYLLTAGQIFSRIPYPLLEVHLGNETPFYYSENFNLMNYFEFVSDRYVSLSYSHHFQGMVLNRIPLMRKLKWRLLGTANLLYGNTGSGNTDLTNTNQPVFKTLKEKPYIEFSYGIENILRLIRVEAFHRLTYTNKKEYPGANNFGIKFSVQFKL